MAPLPDPRAAPLAAEMAVLHVLANRLRALIRPADVSAIMGDIETLLDESIIGHAIRAPITDDMTSLFDLRAIDSEKLSAAFRKGQKRTQVQMLRAKVEQKLGEMIRRNPTRADLLEKFQSMIAEYNAGSASVDQLFEQLLAFIRDVPVASGHSGRLPLGRRVVIPSNNPTNALAAATGFVSTAGDLAKFFAALDPAARRTSLTVESRHEMIRRQWRDPHSSIERHYGLGLWSGTTAGWDWFGHGGSFQGFITRTAVFPGYDLSVSILTNARDGLANQWVDGVCQILAIFATHCAPTPRVRDWTGRWWSLWGAVDLVPMGRRVLVANLDMPAPFTDASELSVTGEDRGRIELANGTGSHGEGVRRVRGPDGKVAEVWLGGGRLLLESDVVTEIVDRYATIRSPEIEQSGPSSPSHLRGYL